MERSSVALVIPAFNEASSIAQVVRGASCYGHVIVVDDGSTDETADLARSSGATVVSHPRNRGYDSALNSGFIKADEMGFTTVITLDADGQHEPFILSKFIESISSGAEVVVGTRSRKQRISEYLFSIYTSVRYGIKDPLCGLKAYNIRLYRALGHFDSYESIGSELAIFAFANGWQTSQISFETQKRKDQSRFGGSLSANLKILRSLWRSIIR